MPPTTDQLRGWKAIAAYLQASERSVKRWEKSRGLPVRRLPGSSRDSVFAIPDEIEAWARAGRAEVGPAVPNDVGTVRAEAGQRVPNDPGAAMLSCSCRKVQADGAVSFGVRSERSVFVVLLGAMVLAFVGYYAGGRMPPGTEPRRVGAVWTKGARAIEKNRPGPSAVVLQVATAQSAARVSIIDGGCGAVALSGHPFIDLCPRLIGDGLFLDVFKRGEGAKSHEKQVTLRLDPNSEVRVPGPLSFDVEWVETSTAAVPTH